MNVYCNRTGKSYLYLYLQRKLYLFLCKHVTEHTQKRKHSRKVMVFITIKKKQSQKFSVNQKINL